MGDIKIAHDLVSLNSFSSSFDYFKKISSFGEAQQVFALEKKLHINAFLFSIKEAAYKVMTKSGFNKAFAPRKFRILSINGKKDFINEFEGIVLYEDVEIFFTTIPDQGFCLSIAGSEQFIRHKLIINTTFYEELTAENQSEIARQQLITMFTGQSTYSNNISIIKSNNGVPYAYAGQNAIPYEISVSHDGQYVSTLIYKNE
ncbi:MAG TPA: hypothetical protein PKW80_08560 [Bacteroidales bacterium]|nr:hypothetical protein [Bacteroidales bacterium]